MKSAKTAKPKAIAAQPTVPEDARALIIVGLSGHEKLYDALAELMGRINKRIFRLPFPERFNNDVTSVIRVMMHNVVLMNLASAEMRKARDEAAARQAKARKLK